jgi:cell division protein FtsN
MTRDYKNAKCDQDRDRPLPGWVWLLTGLTMGLAVALIVYLNQPRVMPVAPQTAVISPPSKQPTEPAQKKKDESTSAKRRFDFYTLLPELEVVVPDDQARSSSATAGADASTPAATATGPYILQAGSFQHAAEAEMLKANLALLGVEADIQTVTVDNNIWHRVRVGPYADLVELNRVRERLTRNQIDTVLLRERQ